MLLHDTNASAGAGAFTLTLTPPTSRSSTFSSPSPSSIYSVSPIHNHSQNTININARKHPCTRPSPPNLRSANIFAACYALQSLLTSTTPTTTHSPQPTPNASLRTQSNNQPATLAAPISFLSPHPSSSSSIPPRVHKKTCTERANPRNPNLNQNGGRISKCKSKSKARMKYASQPLPLTPFPVPVSISVSGSKCERPHTPPLQQDIHLSAEQDILKTPTPRHSYHTWDLDMHGEMGMEGDKENHTYTHTHTNINTYAHSYSYIPFSLPLIPEHAQTPEPRTMTMDMATLALASVPRW